VDDIEDPEAARRRDRTSRRMSEYSSGPPSNTIWFFKFLMGHGAVLMSLLLSGCQSAILANYLESLKVEPLSRRVGYQESDSVVQ
jgi:hypothetical protein